MSTLRCTPSLLNPLLLFLRKNLTDAARVCAALFKIMIPIMVIMKILQELGLIELFGRLTGPVMHLFGLPGSLSLAWATAMLTNLYGGAVVLITLMGERHARQDGQRDPCPGEYVTRMVPVRCTRCGDSAEPAAQG